MQHPMTVISLLTVVSALSAVARAALQLGFYDGGQLDSRQVATRLGSIPASKMGFFSIDATGFSSPEIVTAFTTALLAELPGTAPVYLLQPNRGLASCTDEAFTRIANLLVAQCKRIPSSQVPIYVRFASEMNAPWNAWGKEKNPVMYVDAFRRLTTILRDTAALQGVGDRVRTVWTPNLHFSGLAFSYAAFFPGEEYVDWVGLSCYSPKFDASKTIPDGNFVNRIKTGGGVDFYQTYSVQMNKPMFLETGAAVPVGTAYAVEEQYKLTWATQVFGAAAQWPLFQMVVWLETVQSGQNFGLLQSPVLADKFVASLPAGLIQYGGPLSALPNTATSTSSVPQPSTSLPATSSSSSKLATATVTSAVSTVTATESTIIATATLSASVIVSTTAPFTSSTAVTSTPTHSPAASPTPLPPAPGPNPPSAAPPPSYFPPTTPPPAYSPPSSHKQRKCRTK